MALSKTLKKTVSGFSGELTAENAYIKVSMLTGNKNSMIAFVTGVSDGIQIYAQEHSFVPILGGDNFIAQAYKYLKTLPEFEGAKDC